MKDLLQNYAPSTGGFGPRGPGFDRNVPPGGYQWHYVDGWSDDGTSAIVVIALVGNPFSPTYARARGRGRADPMAFCAMNVALYARKASGWTLDEVGLRDGDRAPDGISIGRSTMRWEDGRLIVAIDERTAPFGRPVRGTVVLTPEATTTLEVPLDRRGEHRWWPIVPLARIEVDLPSPGASFRGHGYHDANAGDAPLESTFERWNWSRARTERGAVLTYDAEESSGALRSIAFRIAADGRVEDLEPSWRAPLGPTAWRLERHARADPGREVRLVRSLEDGPFYARALVSTLIGGRSVLAMHETLAAHRLRRAWVRYLTGFRMRRSETAR